MSEGTDGLSEFGTYAFDTVRKSKLRRIALEQMPERATFRKNEWAKAINSEWNEGEITSGDISGRNIGPPLIYLGVLYQIPLINEVTRFVLVRDPQMVEFVKELVQNPSVEPTSAHVTSKRDYLTSHLDYESLCVTDHEHVDVSREAHLYSKMNQHVSIDNPTVELEIDITENPGWPNKKRGVDVSGSVTGERMELRETTTERKLEYEVEGFLWKCAKYACIECLPRNGLTALAEKGSPEIKLELSGDGRIEFELSVRPGVSW
ncbi:hypothetical protein [Salinigranum marinum]|uniref:hypothetical protein n=1 Tax=Salinigranum marinum TaxID=1515595 RepID=UPI002989FC69|nr:hypothetical protein [Salinigranum marinum]